MSFLKLLSGAAVALSITGASAQAETWDMATPYPDATFHTQNINQFAKDVAAATDGALEINVHSAGSLFKHPEISKAVAFTEGTYNPVTQMGDPTVMGKFDAEELDAIQMDSLADEMERSLDYQVVASYDTLIDIYTQARRS